MNTSALETHRLQSGAPTIVTAPALLTRTIAALLSGAILVVACYFFVDWGVARFVHDHCADTRPGGMAGVSVRLSGIRGGGGHPRHGPVAAVAARRPAPDRAPGHLGRPGRGLYSEVVGEMGLRPLLARDVESRTGPR